MTADMFLILDGAKGESGDDTYPDEIDVLAWSWGASQSATMHSGMGGGSGKVSMQDLSITKYVDKASPILFQKVASGKHFPSAKLICRKAGDNPVEYIVMTMEEVLISSLSTGGSGGEDQLTENISLNFSKIKFKYTPQAQEGAAEAENEPGWNIRANTPWG
jgi:type VI secretion system secreted protein Hcp